MSVPKIIGDGSEFGYTKEEWCNLTNSTRFRLRHPAKMKAATKNWYNNNKEYVREQARKYQLRDKYGITEEQYTEILTAQNNCCAICETKTPTGKWKVFAVDHCHHTHEVRGLLCNECNRGMGLLKDNEILLLKAAAYLIQHKKKSKEERK